MSDLYQQFCKLIQNPMASPLGQALHALSEVDYHPALVPIAVGPSAARRTRAKRRNPIVSLARSLALALCVLAGLLASGDSVQAQTCKVCAEQRAACMKNYAGPACKTEYKMCLKSCKK
ncbi:hypothetical protein [Bradyrhizobium sp. BR 1433]|uniref:hypothetical protein n=1 Tax=Bradyrhizobium sp. BR 1433 TaxID=3447967 RepID=UPI003EE6994D